MSASHTPVLDGDNCTICGRPTADYGDGPQHRRGRVAGRSPFRVPSRADLARMTLDECLEAGYCECGIRLDEHPEITKSRPVRVKQPRVERVKLACSVYGCGRTAQVQGWCHGHYSRLRRNRPVDAPLGVARGRHSADLPQGVAA